MRRSRRPKIRLPASSYEQRCEARQYEPMLIQEDVDGTFHVYDHNTDPDDLAFGRVKPIATFITYGDALEFIKHHGGKI